jgi:diguanylate cyclase (GGDEF)-like protein/PAS domain S-box-containing protein
MLRTSRAQDGYADRRAAGLPTTGPVLRGSRLAFRWSTVRAALELSSDVVLICVPPGLRVVDANRAASLTLGYERGELLGMDLAEIMPAAAQTELVAALEPLVARERRGVTLATTYRHQNGVELPVEVSVGRVDHRRRRAFVVVSRRRDLAVGNGDMPSAIRDGLTGLAGRAWLDDRLERAVDRARQERFRFAVLFVDVDHFKRINDTWGHLAGDAVLRAVATRLQASVRPSDFVARYGGDEFVALLGDVGHPGEVREIARRVSRSMQAITIPDAAGDGPTMVITASIGAAIGSANCPCGAELIRRADRAMYRAKALGRRGYCVLDEM